ncbi:MAG: hypothetical protein Q7U97_08125 [Rhodocyclaceae bacterium]|nr:hypothetical protein [Rhodocyclaceae bacterium]
MTTVATRVREIGDKEGFDIIVTHKGTPVNPAENGVLNGGYPFEKKLKGTKTVSDWKKERFETTYPGYSCDVLKGDGDVATGQTSLETVRASYEEN